MNEEIDGIVVGKGCLICGLLSPHLGCRHVPSWGVALPEVPLRRGFGGGIAGIDSTTPVTMLMNPRTGTPLMGADLDEALARRKDTI